LDRRLCARPPIEEHVRDSQPPERGEHLRLVTRRRAPRGWRRQRRFRRDSRTATVVVIAADEGQNTAVRWGSVERAWDRITRRTAAERRETKIETPG